MDGCKWSVLSLCASSPCRRAPLGLPWASEQGRPGPQGVLVVPDQPTPRLLQTGRTEGTRQPVTCDFNSVSSCCCVQKDARHRRVRGSYSRCRGGSVMAEPQTQASEILEGMPAQVG